MKYFERIWTGKTRKAARSALAGTLAAAMLLPAMTGVRAVAAGLPGVSEGALGIVQATDQEKPTIEIRANAVIDSRGQLTGYLEVGLWVKTPTVYYDAAGKVVTNVPDTVKPDDESTWDVAGIKTAEPQTFSSLGVSLKYNADILTPVAWEGQDEKGEALSGMDLEVKLAAGGQVNLPAKKADEGTTAAAAISHNPVTADTETSKTGMLYFMVEATNGEAVLPDGTLLGVVRFYYDKEKFEPWATESGKTGQATVDGTKGDVTDIGKWFTMTGTADHWLIQYATEDEIMKVITDPGSTIMFSFAGQQVYYISGTNEFYWSEKLDKSECKVVDAIDPANPTDKTKNSLTTNLLRKLNSGVTGEPTDADYTPCVSFKLVNSLSFAQGGGGDQAIIVYYDWDNALIGVQGVTPGDGRADVNKFVEENFIHPDLQLSKRTADLNTLVDSVKREDTYRGNYPAEGPSGNKTVGNGEDYPLTNKLDYAFYTHPTKRIVLADPDGSWSGVKNSTGTAANGGLAEKEGGGELNGDETIQWEPMKAEDWAAETTLDQGAVQYPYTNGWAVVPEKKVHSNNVDDVWTTMGGYRGELVDCKPVKVNYDGGDDTLINSSGYRNYTTAGESSYFHFQDFSELEKDKVYYVKACYEPGENLDYATYQYSPVSDDVYYVRYGTGDSTIANAYSMQFTYRRVNSLDKGVPRTREPAIRVTYYPDYNETRTSYTNTVASLFYGRSNVSNTDIMDIEITAAAAIYRADYTLMDAYGSNYVAGRVCSSNDAISKIALPTNFTYAETDSDDDGKDDGYDERLGTDGFVFRATLRQILEEGVKETKSQGSSIFTTALTLNTFKDLNLMSANRVNVNAFTLGASRNAVLNAIQYAYNHWGEEAALSLDWHQLQYAILHDGAILNKHQCVAADGGYAWCRLGDNCVSGSLPGGVETVGALLNALANNTGDDANLTTDFSLRYNDPTGLKTTKYPSVDAFKNDIKTKVLPVLTTTGGYTNATVKDATWEEVQYILLNGQYKTHADIIADTTANDYWWKPNDAGIEGKKEIPDLATLLDVGWKVYVQGYDSSWLDGLDLNDVIAADKINIWASNDKDSHNFADLDMFKAELETVITTLQTDGGYTDANIKDVPWVEVQNLFLGNTYETATNLETGSAKLDMWWGYDAPTFTENAPTLSELIFAAQVAHKGSETAWDNLTNTILEKLYLAKADTSSPAAGDTFEKLVHFDLTNAADKSAFAGNMEKLLVNAEGAGVSNLTTLTWAQVQYALLHQGAYKANDEINTTDELFWNEGGARPAGLNTLSDFLDAAWRYSNNGDSTAWDKLTPEKIKALYLAKADVAEENQKPGDGFDKLQYFVEESDLDSFKTWMGDLVKAAGDPTYKSLSWLQVQHALFNNGAYVESPDETIAAIYFWGVDGTGTRPGPPTPTIDLDATVTELTRMVTAYYWEADTTVTVAATEAKITEVIDQLKLKKADGSFYTTSDVTALREELENGADNTASSNQFSADGNYVEWSWDELQNYLLTGNVFDDESGQIPADSYTWKPGSGNTLDLFDSLIETFQSIMSRTESSETTTEAETSYDAETGDVTVKTTSTTVMTIILTIGEKELRIEKTFVVENTTFVNGSTYQATTTTRTWEEATKVLTPLEELLPTETPETTQEPGTEENQEPGTDEKADTPVESTEPTPEPTDSPVPETSQKPTETPDPETSETPAETPAPEVSQKPAETPAPTEPETPPSTQTQDPDLTTEPEDQEKTPTEEGKEEPSGAEEEAQTPKTEEPPAPVDQAGDSSTEPPEDETAEVLAIAWLLPPEMPAGHTSQASSVQRC